MFLLPFIWFTLITVLLWRKHQRMDACVYISGLYAMVSLFAVILIAGDLLGDGGILYYNNDAEFGVLPTLLYCTMLTLTIVPFHLVYDKEIKDITCKSPFLLDMLSLFLIGVSVVNLYLVADSTLDILSGNLADVRNSVYSGDATPAQLKAERMGFFMRFYYYFNVSTILCIPILFYNLCFRKKAWWWNLLLFFASLSAPIAGIQGADRTELIYLAEMYLFCLIFFWPHISKTLRRWLFIIGAPIVLLGVVYVAAVSQSRFEDQSEGAAGRNLQYAGQGYINFCYFWDHANYDELAPEREFPMYYHYTKHQDSDMDRRLYRQGQQGFFISVFSTFLGDIMLDISPIGMILWTTCFSLLALLLIRASHRKIFDISEILLIFLMACIPVFGIFYYRFFAFTYTFTIILAILYFIVTRYRIRL